MVHVYTSDLQNLEDTFYNLHKFTHVCIALACACVFIYPYNMCFFIHGLTKEGSLALGRQCDKYMPEHMLRGCFPSHSEQGLNFILLFFFKICYQWSNPETRTKCGQVTLVWFCWNQVKRPCYVFLLLSTSEKVSIGFNRKLLSISLLV